MVRITNAIRQGAIREHFASRGHRVSNLSKLKKDELDDFIKKHDIDVNGYATEKKKQQEAYDKELKQIKEENDRQFKLKIDQENKLKKDNVLLWNYADTFKYKEQVGLEIIHLVDWKNNEELYRKKNELIKEELYKDISRIKIQWGLPTDCPIIWDEKTLAYSCGGMNVSALGYDYNEKKFDYYDSSFDLVDVVKLLNRLCILENIVKKFKRSINNEKLNIYNIVDKKYIHDFKKYKDIIVDDEKLMKKKSKYEKIILENNKILRKMDWTDNEQITYKQNVQKLINLYIKISKL